VDPLTTSVFDLPDHLTAKVDPALIAADGQHFAAIGKTLEQTIADLSDRVDAARRQSGGTGQAEWQMLLPVPGWLVEVEVDAVSPLED
jgi:hypothetical protein